jgi:hypothetical protein
MLVREVVKDAKTGEVITRMVEVPGILTPEEGLVVTAQAAQLDTNARTIEQKAEQYLVDSAAFLALPSPTNAQVLAQVKQNTRAIRGIVRLIRQKFDATD